MVADMFSLPHTLYERRVMTSGATAEERSSPRDFGATAARRLREPRWTRAGEGMEECSSVASLTLSRPLLVFRFRCDRTTRKKMFIYVRV